MSRPDASDRGGCHHTLADEPGPIDADRECDHAGQLPQDPPFQYVQECDEQAVFAVRHPQGLGQCIAFCPWHLARFLDAFPDHEQRLREHFELDEHLSDSAWVSLTDLPANTHVPGEGDRWPLVALDQRGYAYYTDSLDDPRGIALYTNDDWSEFDAYDTLPEEASLQDVVDKIAELRGLAGLPADVGDRLAADNRGGGQ